MAFDKKDLKEKSVGAEPLSAEEIRLLTEMQSWNVNFEKRNFTAEEDKAIFKDAKSV